VNALPAPPSVTASTAAPSGAGAGNKPRPVRTRAGLLPSGGARHRCRVDSSDRPSAEAAGARPAIPVSMRDCEACGDGKVTPPASPRGARGPSSEDELYPATSSRTASLRHGAVLGLGIGRVMINAQPRSSCAVRGCGGTPRGSCPRRPGSFAFPYGDSQGAFKPGNGRTNESQLPSIPKARPRLGDRSRPIAWCRSASDGAG
jgi:hypothetical protein